MSRTKSALSSREDGEAEEENTTREVEDNPVGAAGAPNPPPSAHIHQGGSRLETVEGLDSEIEAPAEGSTAISASVKVSWAGALASNRANRARLGTTATLWA